MHRLLVNQSKTGNSKEEDVSWMTQCCKDRGTGEGRENRVTCQVYVCVCVFPVCEKFKLRSVKALECRINDCVIVYVLWGLTTALWNKVCENVVELLNCLLWVVHSKQRTFVKGNFIAFVDISLWGKELKTILWT